MNADEVVRIDEAVKALHRLSVLLVTPDSIVCCEATDLIESLQAQLAKYDEVAAEYGIDGKTMLTLAKSQIKTAQDNIKLQEQLAASREKDEREKGCNYCLQTWPDRAAAGVAGVSDIWHGNKLSVGYGVYREIKFCPMCGKSLEEVTNER